jgi:hypothetical protein
MIHPKVCLLAKNWCSALGARLQALGSQHSAPKNNLLYFVSDSFSTWLLSTITIKNIDENNFTHRFTVCTNGVDIDPVKCTWNLNYIFEKFETKTFERFVLGVCLPNFSLCSVLIACEFCFSFTPISRQM